MKFIPLFVVLVFAWTSGARAADRVNNLLVDGDFERPAHLVKSNTPGVWGSYIHGQSDATIAQVDGEGRNASRCMKYSKTQAGSQNIHFDQVIAVEKDSVYEVTAWVRGDGQLKPILSVTAMDWKVLSQAHWQPATQWTSQRFLFQSYGNEMVRLEWFPGSDGQLNRGVAGVSYLDDVVVRKIDPVPPSLKLAFEVRRPRQGQEIDLASVRTEPVGKPAPLRAITCRDGVLRYEDGTEVALWGVNIQTALSWEYLSRLKSYGIPLEAEVLKKMSTENLEQIRQMDGTVVRLHLLPSDFTDAEGNLRDSIFLDVLDHLLEQCREKRIYVYLTLVNEMKQAWFKDSFLSGRDRREWITDPAIVEKTARYIRALLDHENRYTKTKYKDEPAIALFEISNEPGYVDYATMKSDAMFAPLREAFAQWCTAQKLQDYPETYYAAYRYEVVRDYINRMCETIRGTGSQKPVAWNLNWPQMISAHEDVYQAAADSSVDAISFCLYPGQSDVPSPYWNNPMDLSVKNYLPYLHEHYTQYWRLRWVLGQRFAKKAKLVYEFETFYNQSSYLYPAMARLFRSLGVQMAQMWTYSLSPAAERMSGTHYLNLLCTPQKAVSFAIASHVFTQTPRYAPYDFEAKDDLKFGDCAVSFAKNVSILQSGDTYMQSRPQAWTPLPTNPGVRRIVACGNSPLVSYEGTGVYFIDITDNSIDIRINPDATFVRPPWQQQRRATREVTCALDWKTPHRMTLRLPGWQGNFGVWRMDGANREAVKNTGPTPNFETRPGLYRLEKQATAPSNASTQQ